METQPKAAAAASKKRGGLSSIRTALFMARRRSPGKKPADGVRSGGRDLWRNLVCGMRPLHLHQLEHLPSPPPTPAADSYHDVLPPPPSPSQSSADSMSRYASAEDLRMLDVSEEEGGDGTECGGDGGSNEIDAQAEEFIARFYEQIRLQRLESMGRVGAC